MNESKPREMTQQEENTIKFYLGAFSIAGIIAFIVFVAEHFYPVPVEAFMWNWGIILIVIAVNAVPFYFLVVKDGIFSYFSFNIIENILLDPYAFLSLLGGITLTTLLYVKDVLPPLYAQIGWGSILATPLILAILYMIDNAVFYGGKRGEEREGRKGKKGESKLAVILLLLYFSISTFFSPHYLWHYYEALSYLWIIIPALLLWHYLRGMKSKGWDRDIAMELLFDKFFGIPFGKNPYENTTQNEGEVKGKREFKQMHGKPNSTYQPPREDMNQLQSALREVIEDVKKWNILTQQQPINPYYKAKAQVVNDRYKDLKHRIKVKEYEETYKPS